MSRVLRRLMNLCIVGFFVLGSVVAALSFGLFGCYCIGGPPMQQETPAVKGQDTPLKVGEMPPLPSPK